MPARLGERVTPRSAGIAKTVILALADDLRSVTEIAVSVTVGGLGAFAGAVYVMDAPDALEALRWEERRARAERRSGRAQDPQLLRGSFWTVAVKPCVSFT